MCIRDRITLRIYNADHEADYANGFEPDVKIEELVIGNDLLPFGDTNERLLSEALSRISGLKSLPVPVSYTHLDVYKRQPERGSV